MKKTSLCACTLPVLAAGTFALWPAKGIQATPSIPSPSDGKVAAIAIAITPAQQPAAPAVPAEESELHAAIEQGIVKGDFRGNGRDKLTVRLTNTSRTPLKISAPIGQVFESGVSAVAVIRAAQLEVAPGATSEIVLTTIALRSGTKLTEAAYKPSYTEIAKLVPLFRHAVAHPELSTAALQTAALALSENLPLNAVAKFAPSNGAAKSRFNTDAFRVETSDIIAALAALRTMGVADSQVAMTIDPQLKIEAMIEPLSRAIAKKYYGLTEETEWEYWKGELLSGDASTRHYALYGIARFYPEIALDMLPKWAREPKTHPVYRLSAVQALAETQRPEALTALRQLADELGDGTELGKAARGAAEYLDQRLGEIASRQATVAFRASQRVSAF